MMGKNKMTARDTLSRVAYSGTPYLPGMTDANEKVTALYVGFARPFTTIVMIFPHCSSAAKSQILKLRHHLNAGSDRRGIKARPM
jgi:hypothetical protein